MFRSIKFKRTRRKDIMNYYGQYEVDRYIHKNFIKTSFENGTFLELGAIDGVKFSNTKFFEDNMGFNSGVLIEPDPRSFKSLAKNRPNCECFNYAIHDSKKEIPFMISQQNAVGCSLDEASNEFLDRWHKDSKKITVPSKRLDNILHKSKLEYIDFWSLDVEGSEMQCLNSMDWSIPVGLILVEVTKDRDLINDKLIQEGFTFISKHWINEVYFNNNYFRKDFFNNVNIT